MVVQAMIFDFPGRVYAELEEKRADNRLPVCKRQAEGWRPVKEGGGAVSDRAEPGGGAQYHWVKEGQSPCSSANHSKGVK